MLVPFFPPFFVQPVTVCLPCLTATILGQNTICCSATRLLTLDITHETLVIHRTFANWPEPAYGTRRHDAGKNAPGTPQQCLQFHLRLHLSRSGSRAEIDAWCFGISALADTRLLVIPGCVGDCFPFHGVGSGCVPTQQAGVATGFWRELHALHAVRRSATAQRPRLTRLGYHIDSATGAL